MRRDLPQPECGEHRVDRSDPGALPQPSLRFRRRSWLAFQRALDPLAPPKALPPEAIRPRRPPSADA